MSEMKAKASPMAAWMNVLDHIEQSLGQSMARTTEFEGPPPSPDAGNPLERLDARLAAWQSALEGAERKASQADSQLEAEKNALSGWLAKLEQVRTGFTSWMQRYDQPKP